MVDPNARGVFSADVLAARTELAHPGEPLHSWRTGAFDCALYCSGPSIWLIVNSGGTLVALRALRDAMEAALVVHHVEAIKGEITISCSTHVAAYRVKVKSGMRNDSATVRCTSSLLPVNDLLLSVRGRDLYLLPANPDTAEPSGRLYAGQQGFQTGSLFCAVQSPGDFSLLYLQNFSMLSKYFEQTETTPDNSVGGMWPELGFELPVSSAKKLLESNEYVTSDAFLTLCSGAPSNDGEAAERYLDTLAAATSLLDPVPTSFHFWPSKATSTVFDLSQSPLCQREVEGHRYLAPYVDDKTKPPESMVQLCVLVALMEYQAWSNQELTLVNALLESLPTFWDEEVGSVVRWLPGERFNNREDEHQTHEAMDSWYLYHVYFNLVRLAKAGVKSARRLLENSLPYGIRVARRFGYRWPIFFNLKTLDIIQAEASKGSGGENDVSGLYALVMLQAHDLFGDQEYLDEAMHAAQALEGLGFRVLYQTNTTGFAAEAMLRLYLLTGDERYRKLSHICVANIFDMMAIWERSYGYARGYSTFFGLYPLRNAPYLAAYEELETMAKFFEYLRLGGADVPASIKQLMCEYSRHLLSRGWSYYPSELPLDALAPKSRNGRVARELAIPLEDLQDGKVQSGQVGQEIYGAGLSLVCTTRFFHRVAGMALLVFCEYPMFLLEDGSFEIAGDRDSTCCLRLISTDPNVVPDAGTLRMGKSAPKGARLSVEGHLLVDVRGGDIISIHKTARRSMRRR